MSLELVGYLILLLIFLIIIFFWKNYDNLEFTTLNGIAKKVSKFEKLNSDDFKKKKEYYRDIIYRYSPVLLSYIDDFELDLPRDIVGNIMALEIKKCLKIENGIFINKENVVKYQKNINNVDKYILQNINDGILEINADEIKKVVQKEGLQEKLLEKNVKEVKINTNNLIVMLVIFSIIFSILSILVVCGVKSVGLIYIMIVLMILFLLLLILSYMVFSYKDSLAIYRKQNPFFRTEKGNEVNRQLEGLKDYLQDYSDMKDKEAKMIEIWEDYLIYSVIFHQNNVALKKYLKYIKIN